MNRLLRILFLISVVTVAGRAAEPEVVYLWNGVAPGSEGQTGEEVVRLSDTGEHIVSNIHRPSLTVYLPTAATTPTLAVLVIPGGGHREIWTDHEGHNVARWLSARGIAAFILKYRLPGQEGSPYKMEHEVADGIRAVRLLRAQAERWHIDPARIGVIGFSAGGELAARVALGANEGNPNATDPVEKQSSRVAFQALMYPANPEIIQPKKESPPAFLCWGFNDHIPTIADGMGSVYSRFRDVHVPVEMHVYSDAGHGFGIRATDTSPAGKWIERFYEWLGSRGLLKTSSSATMEPARAENHVVVVENGGTGPYSAIATEDRTVPGITIYRPADLSPFGGNTKLPILLWGNGACANTTQEHKNFLNEIASRGYMILAIGLLDQIDQRNETSRQPTYSKQLIAALDWMLAQNNTPGSLYFGRVDSAKVAAMGMSCGGLQAIEISGDPRISTTVVCNSGVLPEPSSYKIMPAITKAALANYHAPVIYIMGGPSDIAYKNAMDDFARVNHVPIIMTNFDVGHGGTYSRPHGGEFTRVALAWLDWQLKGREDASKQFLDAQSELRRDPQWKIELKNFAAR